MEGVEKGGDKADGREDNLIAVTRTGEDIKELYKWSGVEHTHPRRVGENDVPEEAYGARMLDKRGLRLELNEGGVDGGGGEDGRGEGGEGEVVQGEGEEEA
jgi:hypothetical protein